MRAVATALFLAVSATAVSAPTAHADDDPLTEAMRLEAALDYNAALVIVEREIARGAADRDRLVRLHMFAGKLAAGLDRVHVAEDHFARVLALAPTTTFAAGTSPKILEPFDAARIRTSPLNVSATVEGSTVTIAAASDPNRLVAGVAVQLEGGREIRERQGLRVALPTGARPTHVSALDAFGNRVWTEPVAQGTSVGVTMSIQRPLYQRWPFWATSTGVALAVGGLCAWRFNAAQDEWDERKADGTADFTELQDIEDRGRRWGLAANISFGVAAAATIATIVTAARGSSTTVVFTGGTDSAGLGLAGRF